MTAHIVFDLVRQIYATFGKKEPLESSGIVQTLAANVSDIPDSAAQYIYERIADQNAMPANLTKAFKEAWNAYCAANPDAVKYQRPVCRYCFSNGGWTYFKRDGGKWWQFWSKCPHCTVEDPKSNAPRKTPSQLMSEGALVVPSDYPGGVVQFRQAYGIDPPAPKVEYVHRSIENLRGMVKRVQAGYAE